MTEVKELIKQAEGVLKKWHKPKGIPPPSSGQTWQELLDHKPYPHLRVSKL